MPRPKHSARKKRLTELAVRKLKPGSAPYLIWDTHQPGLAIRVQPTGARAWKAIYSRHGRPRWYHIGDAGAIGLADARKLAARVMLAVAEGKDPAAERKAERGSGTFADLHAKYLETAKLKNKSWRQSEYLIRRYAMPRWAKLAAPSITYDDVEALLERIEAPVLANQVLAAISAVFSWAVKKRILPANPCRGIERNKTKSRERILSESEVPKFWKAFDDAGLIISTALKIILLSGQRPGECAAMRHEHRVDGWWEMPGEPVPALGWPGTKNGENHRVWLPAPVQALIEELTDGATTGFVFPAARGRRAIWGLDAAMRAACKKLGVERATPHDLRRTHGSTITALGFGRDAMNRIQNHKEGGIASVYDRHGYADETKRVMDAVAARIMALVEGAPAGNVLQMPVKR
jgi:integrase